MVYMDTKNASRPYLFKMFANYKWRIDQIIATLSTCFFYQDFVKCIFYSLIYKSQLSVCVARIFFKKKTNYKSLHCRVHKK